jgi:hypothetical protein
MKTDKPKNPHAVALGKIGGAAVTPAKAEAARRNGCQPCGIGKFRGRPLKVERVAMIEGEPLRLALKRSKNNA